MPKFMLDGKEYGGSDGDSSIEITQVEYDELVRSNSVKKDVTYYITDSKDEGDASLVKYDNTESGLEATDVQSAIDEVTNSISEQNENLTVRYNPETDMFQVYFNGAWVNAIKAYAQSENWFPNICTDSTNIFGEVSFVNKANGSHNGSTYKTNGYIYFSYSSTSNGEAGMFSGNKIPLNVYSSITIKYKQTAVGLYPLTFLMSASKTLREATVALGAVPNSTSSDIKEYTFDLSNYNSNGVELYLHVWMLGTAYIYDITFNK